MSVKAARYRRQDHPRTCGENSEETLKSGFDRGSPPHLRGKLTFTRKAVLVVGITPAPAGKTVRYRCKNAFRKDHPRTCGENYAKSLNVYTNAGSPPHLRGKLNNFTFSRRKIRITPAPAGKTVCMKQIEKLKKDHPRTCGENSFNLEQIQ